jgi:peptidoglycan/LPS O-acetylase OafA/YrhL
MSALWLAGIIHMESRDLWHAATYTVNYERQSSWQIGHLWSLSVEEQFYFLWPFAFIATRPSRRILVVCSVILMAPVARLGAVIFLRTTSYRDMAMFPMVADSLAAGCLLALIRPWLEQQQWYLRIFQPVWAISLLGMIFLANHFEKYSIVSVAGTSLMNLSLAILIHRSVFEPRDWIGGVLNWKPVAWLGGISYSLYLWQQVFINRNSDAWINAFPQNLVLAVLAALASWLLLEKPLLKMRHRLRVRASV